MSLYRRNAKRDDSEAAVVARLRQLGASVERVSGRDLPDLIVGWRSSTHLVEVKTGKAKLKPGQAKFQQRWTGAPVVVLRDPEDATSWLLNLAPHQVLAAMNANPSPATWDDV